MSDLTRLTERSGLMRIVITTSDDYTFLLRGFAHQWNKYAALPATIVYRNTPPPELAPNFTPLASPARFFDWSGSLKNALLTMSDEIVLLGLEDFWLSAPVDENAFSAALHYIETHNDVMRIDLTEDRSAFPYVERDGYLQAVFDPKQIQYPLSTQFSLWRRAFLIHALRDGEIPPQFEVEASRVAVLENPVILGTGTRVFPCHGDGVVWNGKLDALHLEYLTAEDAEELRQLGYA